MRLHVIEDEIFSLAMPETETTLGISKRRGLIPAAGDVVQRRVRSQGGARRLVTVGRCYYP